MWHRIWPCPPAWSTRSKCIYERICIFVTLCHLKFQHFRALCGNCYLLCFSTSLI
jgi:hypothetical protein